MARFDLLFEQEFTNVDSISITHNLNRYVFNIRLVIVGPELSLSQRHYVRDVELDLLDPLNKCVVKLTGLYTGKIQIIAEDTIQSPYYTVAEKLEAQQQTELSGTFPVEFEYGGNALAGRSLEYVNSTGSFDLPYKIVGNGIIRAVVFGSGALNTGTIGVYAKRSGGTVLLHTITFTNQDTKIDKPLSIAVLDNDQIYVDQITGSSNKPYVAVYFQTV